MPGPRPKDPAARRRRNEPARGEWTDIADPAPNPPDAPEGTTPRAAVAWAAWWADPASSQWSESDRDLVLHLLDLYEIWLRRPSASNAMELRYLRDSLGLTPKGRQDRRWRIPRADVVPLADAPSAASARDRVRAVDAA